MQRKLLRLSPSIVGLALVALLIVALLVFRYWRSNEIAFLGVELDGRIGGIYRLNLLAGDPELIASIDVAQPAYSPDGRWIAFVSSANAQGDPPYHISVMRSDGSDVHELTKGPIRDYSPAWSPDGRQIAFVSAPEDPKGTLAVFVMSSDGTDIRRVTPRGYFNGLSWSPDGQKLALMSQAGYQVNIYTMHPDGSDLVRMTYMKGDNSPKWSPDGEFIVFSSSGEDTSQLDIYTVREDGSDVRRLTNGPAIDLSPDWSPDGKRILFQSNWDSADSTDHIYVMDADGTAQRRVTDFPGIMPIWRP